MESGDQSAGPVREIVDARRQPRFKIAVDIGINSRTCGLLTGHTVDISESGISAMLRIEVPLGEVVELGFTLPFGPVTIYAMVRQRNAFRYGFQFVESNAMHEVIQTTCHYLADAKSLMRKP
ncbi:MAG: PilZ domain-containing protein [Candidatus Sulfotelmatobacter sp.]